MERRAYSRVLVVNNQTVKISGCSIKADVIIGLSRNISSGNIDAEGLAKKDDDAALAFLLALPRDRALVGRVYIAERTRPHTHLSR